MLVAALSTLTLFVAALLVVRPGVIFGGTPARLRPALAGVAVVVLLGGIALPDRAAAQGVDATQLMAESLKASKALRSTAIGRFVLTNRAGQSRIRQTLSVSEAKPDGGGNRRVVRFTGPADIAGTSVLTVENAGADDDIWVYLPALKKVRRLPASSRKDAFVGTDFSYGDVLGHPVAEWNHRVLRSETLAGVAARVIESTPRDAGVTASTGYGRRLSWLRASDNVLVKAEYFDATGTLVKAYGAEDVRLVDPANRRFQAMRQTMRNLTTGHSTTIEYSSFRTDQPVAASQFQPRSLENAR
jgi:hypothetical protein